MKGVNIERQERTCPDCNEETSIISLGNEPAREVCGRFGCGWNGVTLG